MPEVDREDIRSTLLTSIGRDAVSFVEDAALLGWKVMVSSNGTSVTLIPAVQDTPQHRIHLSSRNKGKGKGPLARRYETLVKFGDPGAVKMIAQLARAGESSGASDAVDRVLTGMAQYRLGMKGNLEVEKPEPKKERFIKPEPAEVPEVIKAAVQKRTERHIVSERPAMMHYNRSKGVGRSYASETTVERRWSDGTVDYTCAVSTCGVVSDNRLSFRGAHWAKHVREGDAQPVKSVQERGLFEDPSYTEAAFSRQGSNSTRVAKLITLLQGIDLSTITPEQLAEQIDAYLTDLREGGGSVGSEPLTSDQILDRIRRLCDTGKYAEQETALLAKSQEVDDLLAYSEQREAELQAEVTAATRRATEAESTLQALGELVQQATQKESA